MLTLNDGRSELWQWDTGRKLSVDADCSQVHFSNKVFGRSIDVDVIDGVAEIPDFLLQTDKELCAWAFVGTAENGYTKISKVFKVNKRNKPADYVFTPPEQTTLGELIERLDKIEESQDPDAIKNAVDDYLANNPIKIDETDPTVSEWAKQPTKPSYTASEVGALPDDTVIPTIPENVSAFRNDAGYLKEHQDISGPLPRTELPTAIDTALAQAKDSGEFDGPQGSQGKPGNGIKSAILNADYTLTLTFDDGTSYTTPSIRGATGQTGQPGGKGDPGTSVTVKSVTESTADGGSNVVVFSDGKTVTIKNGKKGADGKNPEKGVDYWTDADQEAMVQQVITALGTPVFGRVEEGNKITFSTEHLADGTYYFGYEDEDGNWVEIGTLNHTVVPEPTYTNILDGIEIKLNQKWSKSSAVYKSCNGVVSFDLPWPFAYSLQSNDIIRLKGFPVMSTNSNGGYSNWYWHDTDGNDLEVSFRYKSDGTTYYGQIIWDSNYVDEGNGVYSYAFAHSTLDNAYKNRDSIAYMRVNMCISDSAVTASDVANLIITYNEPIE